MSRLVLTAEAKATMRANLELELATRREKLVAMCDAQCASLQSRLERRINRVPANKRHMNIMTFIDSFSAKAAAQAPTRKKEAASAAPALNNRKTRAAPARTAAAANTNEAFKAPRGASKAAAAPAAPAPVANTASKAPRGATRTGAAPAPVAKEAHKTSHGTSRTVAPATSVLVIKEPQKPSRGASRTAAPAAPVPILKPIASLPAVKEAPKAAPKPAAKTAAAPTNPPVRKTLPARKPAPATKTAPPPKVAPAGETAAVNRPFPIVPVSKKSRGTKRTSDEMTGENKENAKEIMSGIPNKRPKAVPAVPTVPAARTTRAASKRVTAALPQVLSPKPNNSRAAPAQTRTRRQR
ncbi:hypothetical protein BDV95DRAFT_620617 [Massariosphaeria phaeospora]|uniref:Borealin N-terminal domain-containing protein n=1 Tax=Massariosphaeria phaeospora TaxID=100035 RepID=A0A7C8I7N5_9PLEO|nr:hypothetical protein BDV95DRAFT_620617 [Massariosphaeria phaeospora]